LLAACAGDTWLGPRDFGGVKPKQLLEMLLLEHGRMVTMDNVMLRVAQHDPTRGEGKRISLV
jgi:hypothetical protein